MFARKIITLTLACLLTAAPLSLRADDDVWGSISDLNLFGVAHPKKQAVLRFTRQGIVNKVHVQDGQKVNTDDLLLSLDDRIAQVAIQMAQVEAEQDAALRTAQIDLERLSDHYARILQGHEDDEDAVSKFELEAKKAEVDRAQAAVDLEKERKRQAEARLLMAREEANSLTLKAPFSGTVIQVHIDHGNTVSPSENAITIAQLEELEIEMHLPISWFGKITKGNQYVVRAGSPVNKDIAIQAEFISPSVDSTSETFRAVFLFDNREQKLPSGFEVRDLRTSTQPTDSAARVRQSVNTAKINFPVQKRLNK